LNLELRPCFGRLIVEGGEVQPTETWAGLPLGDWATWVAAFFGLLAFLGVIAGLVVEGERRRRDIARVDAQRHQDQTQRHWDEISAQAILVGGVINWPTQTADIPAGRDRLELTVINASPLPIRHVVGHVIRKSDGGYHGHFLPMPVVPPGETLATLDTVPSEGQFDLQLQFDDDAGHTWLKYREPTLMQMTNEQWPERLPPGFLAVV